MPIFGPDAAVERRRIEHALERLGEERGRLAHAESMNRQKMRALLEPAREAGIPIRDIARMTGLSTQTLHTWQLQIMRPVPAVHLGRIGPPPENLAEAVLRTIGEEPDRVWTATEVKPAIPSQWPTGSTHEVRLALDMLARSLQIWEDKDGYRLTPPPEIQETLRGAG